MIIDCHLHISSVKKQDQYPDVDRLMLKMHNMGIDKAGLITSGNRGYLFANKQDIINAAEGLNDIAAKYPNVFYSMIWMNPCLPFDFLKYVTEKYILGGSISGVKLSIQMNARDTRMEPFIELLQKYDIPVLFHSWYKTVNKYQFESDPSDIACLASKFPSLRILMPHITGCGFRGIQDIKPYPNICIDTSGSQPEDGFLAYGLKELGVDRIFYGSDYPGRDLATQLGRIYSIDISEEQREKLLSGNAAKFFTRGDMNA